MTAALVQSPASEAATRIVLAQRKVVGDAALKLAARVSGVSVASDGTVVVSGVDADVLDRLVREYSAITGTIAVRMCYLAAAPVLRQHPEIDVPSLAQFR